MNKSIFRAYDIRGKYPTEINEETVEEISLALLKHFGSKAKIVIGHDARLSSPALYKKIKSILKTKKLIDGGLMTTPMLYYLVNEHKADGGIMVTASHNPKEYNGLKIVGKHVSPISGKSVLKMIGNQKQA